MSRIGVPSRRSAPRTCSTGKRRCALPDRASRSLSPAGSGERGCVMRKRPPARCRPVAEAARSESIWRLPRSCKVPRNRPRCPRRCRQARRFRTARLARGVKSSRFPKRPIRGRTRVRIRCVLADGAQGSCCGDPELLRKVGADMRYRLHVAPMLAGGLPSLSTLGLAEQMCRFVGCCHRVYFHSVTKNDIERLYEYVFYSKLNVMHSRECA